MYLAECVGEGVVPRRVLTPDHLTAMSNIPASGGSPVRRSDLSEHVLYDLDATDWYADSEPELPAPVCSGIYRPSGDWGVSVCDRCGDVSDSQAYLPCGRVDDDLVNDDDPAELARMAADWAANAPASAGRNPFLR